MSFNSNTGKTVFTGTSDYPPLLLDQVLSFKYLGVPLNCSPYKFFHCFNNQVKQRAQSYLSRVLSLIKTGPDQSNLAYTLWKQVALPSILYGAEVIPLTDGTIAEVERCQAAVGKFMLNLPRSSASVSAHLDAGFLPIKFMLAEKVLNYANITMTKPVSFWPKLAMTENLQLGSTSSYTRYLLKWKAATNSFALPPKEVRAAVHKAAIIDVLDQQRLVSTTTFAMNEPHSKANHWFKPKPWVNDSGLSKIFSQFRALNSGLGNRGPAKDGNKYKLCPLCSKLGIRALNNEVTTSITL